MATRAAVHRSDEADTDRFEEVIGLVKNVLNKPRYSAEEAARIKATIDLARNTQNFRLASVLEQMNDVVPYKFASRDEFRKSPRTFLKTLQEVLSPENARIAFPRTEANKNENIRRIIIDPSRITDTLLLNLGLDEFIPPKGTKLSPSERMDYKVRAINAIREMLYSLEPFALEHEIDRGKHRYFRLMRISHGKNEGYVLGTQELEEESDNDESYDEQVENRKKRKVLFKTDLHGAYRRIDQIKGSYDTEIETLREINKIAKYVYSEIGKDKPIDNEFIGLKDQLMDCVDSLKHVKNVHKREMKAAIEKSMHDSTFSYREKGGKTFVVYDPKQAKVELARIPLLVGTRLAEMIDISAFLARDKMRVKDIIDQQPEPFKDFYEIIEQAHADLHTLNVDVPVTPAKRDKIVDKFNSLTIQCSPDSSFARAVPRFQPYVTLANQFAAHTRAAAILFKKENFNEHDNRAAIASEFTKAYLVSKMERFYVAFNQFYTKWLSGAMRELKIDQVNPANDEFMQATEEMKQLRLMISTKRVPARIKQPDGTTQDEFIRTPEYDAVFHNSYQLIDDLIALAEKRDRKEMRKRVKAHNFADLMIGIPVAA